MSSNICIHTIKFRVLDLVFETFNTQLLVTFAMIKPDAVKKNVDDNGKKIEKKINDNNAHKVVKKNVVNNGNNVKKKINNNVLKERKIYINEHKEVKIIIPGQKVEKKNDNIIHEEEFKFYKSTAMVLALMQWGMVLYAYFGTYLSTEHQLVVVQIFLALSGFFCCLYLSDKLRILLDIHI